MVPGAREIGAVLILPAGHHRVSVSGSRGASFLVDLVSLVSSSIIVAFGTTATLLLFLLYMMIRIRRLFHYARVNVAQRTRA